jgi:hypothetical protein
LRAHDQLGRGLLAAPLVFVAHFLGLLITILVLVVFWATDTAAAVVLVVAWLSFLMLTNAVFHITGAIVAHGYVPGLATAILLYLPYCGWVGWQVVRQHRAALGLLAAAAVLGAIPMAVHGYRILFLGTRLF